MAALKSTRTGPQALATLTPAPVARTTRKNRAPEVLRPRGSRARPNEDDEQDHRGRRDATIRALLQALDVEQLEAAERGWAGLERVDEIDPAYWGPAPDAPEIAQATRENLVQQFRERRGVELESLTSEEASELLGVTPQAITSMIRDRRVIALKRARSWVLPQWQFAADAATGLLPGLAKLIAAYPAGPVSLTRWATRANPDLAGSTPAEALKSQPADVVIAAQSLTAAAW